VQEGLCLVLMLEADDGVVRITDDDHVADAVVWRQRWTHKSYT
jgi:hypothetical protein